MAKFFLINSVSVGGLSFIAGSEIDDTVDDKVAIQNAGGVLWPSSNTVIAAAAAKAQQARLNRGANEQVCNDIMQAALDSLQGGQVGQATLVAGTVTINTGIQVNAASQVFVTRVTPGGTVTSTIEYECVAKTAGGPGTGSITLQASVAAGTVNAADTSVVGYAIMG